MYEATEALLSVYASDEGAHAALARLAARARVGRITLVDVGLLRRESTGRVALTSSPVETLNLAIQQPRTVDGLVGLIFPPNALVTLVDGAAIGAVATQLKRTGVEGASLQRLGAMLSPGESAVLVVVDRPWVGQVQDALLGYDHVVHTRLGPPIDSATVDEQDEGEGRNA
jgi:uncharacterized membrane protein